MSYCRIGGDSDLYVYGNANDSFTCAGCGDFSNLLQLHNHLMWHQARGDKVPQYAIDRVEKELDKELRRK